ncbi:MAG: hypothetical protein ACEQSR_01425 [Candidatus Methylacidiphilales bacterium]
MKKIITICLIAVGLIAKAQTPTYVVPQKDPSKSFVQSLLVPGLGQMYNEQVTLGLAVFGVEASLITAGVITASNPDLKEITWISLFAGAGVIHLVQLVHAPIVSDRINKANKTKSNYNEWSFNATPVNVNLAFRF